MFFTWHTSHNPSTVVAGRCGEATLGPSTDRPDSLAFTSALL